MVRKSWCSLLKINHLDSFGILEDYQSFIEYDSSWMLLTYKIESFGLLPGLRRLRKRKATILFGELEVSMYGWLCRSLNKRYRSSLTQEILNIDLIHSFKNEWIVWLWISKLQFYVTKVLPLPSTSLALPPFLSRIFSAQKHHRTWEAVLYWTYNGLHDLHDWCAKCRRKLLISWLSSNTNTKQQSWRSWVGTAVGGFSKDLSFRASKMASQATYGATHGQPLQPQNSELWTSFVLKRRKKGSTVRCHPWSRLALKKDAIHSFSCWTPDSQQHKRNKYTLENHNALLALLKLHFSWVIVRLSIKMRFAAV